MENSKKAKNTADDANNNRKTQEQTKSVMQPRQKSLLRYYFSQNAGMKKVSNSGSDNELPKWLSDFLFEYSSNAWKSR